jgi:hypothetical protein
VAGRQSHLHGDRSTQRMADKMSAPDSFRIHHGKGILGHSLNRDIAACGLAISHPAIVERHATEMANQRLGLWKPAVSMKTDPLDKNHRLAGSFNFVDE